MAWKREAAKWKRTKGYLESLESNSNISARKKGVKPLKPKLLIFITLNYKRACTSYVFLHFKVETNQHIIVARLK